MTIDEPVPPDAATTTALDKALTTADLAGSSPARDDSLAEPRSFRAAEPDDLGTSQVVQTQTPLFPVEEAGDLRGRWNEIQAGFVDEPRRAVEQADSLVAGAMKRLAETFADERAKLEGQWDRGNDVSTEDLRLALQRYRSFFGRLLAI
jgi:hypothetical protein